MATIKSLEEKAKAYDNIIKKANKMHSENCEACQMCIEELIPELKESEDEDEKIRKALKEYFVNSFQNNGVAAICGVHIKDILAWLEKQGEQNPISLEDAAKLFLEKLSESPYNNKPITDAQVITKELINFLKDTNTYNPNAINEQKPAWSEEDELYIRELESIVKQVWATAEHKNDKDTIHKMSDLSFFLKTLKPQPKREWKQENTDDLTDFENVMMHIGDSFFGQHAGLDPNDTNAIKEQANLLLELVPSKEWSEEDENIKESIITGLEMLKDGASDKSLIALYNKKINWLKSLKPQSQWKPTEEQLRELENVFSPDTDSWDEDILRELYEQLKQL